MPPLPNTGNESFVKMLQLQRHRIEYAFGEIGTAFMSISDLFPEPSGRPSSSPPTPIHRP